MAPATLIGCNLSKFLLLQSFGECKIHLSHLVTGVLLTRCDFAFFLLSSRTSLLFCVPPIVSHFLPGKPSLLCIYSTHSAIFTTLVVSEKHIYHLRFLIFHSFSSPYFKYIVEIIPVTPFRHLRLQSLFYPRFVFRSILVQVTTPAVPNSLVVHQASSLRHHAYTLG